MATVKMIKNGKFADIFESAETIKQAQLEGYTLVAAEEKVEEKPAVKKGKKPEND